MESSKKEEISKKNDAKMMLEKVMQKWCQNDAKMEPKLELKSIKNRKNAGKKESQKKHEFWQCPGGIPLTPRAPQTHTIQQDNLQINYTEQQKKRTYST